MNTHNEEALAVAKAEAVREERERIMSRLHELEGRCSHCGAFACRDKKNTTLPNYIKISSVIDAVNLDET